MNEEIALKNYFELAKKIMSAWRKYGYCDSICYTEKIGSDDITFSTKNNYSEIIFRFGREKLIFHCFSDSETEITLPYPINIQWLIEKHQCAKKNSHILINSWVNNT